MILDYLAKLKSKTHKNNIFSYSSFAYIISLHIKITWQLVKEIIKNLVKESLKMV